MSGGDAAAPFDVSSEAAADALSAAGVVDVVRGAAGGGGAARAASAGVGAAASSSGGGGGGGGGGAKGARDLVRLRCARAWCLWCGPLFASGSDARS